MRRLLSVGGPKPTFAAAYLRPLRSPQQQGSSAAWADWVKPAQATCCVHSGDTIISLRHRTQRALVPTISQAWSPDTMSRRHFGQVYPASCRQRSHTADRHRRRSCDGAPEKTPARRRRKPGTPIDLLQSASCAASLDSALHVQSKPEEPDQPVGDAGGKVGVVHVNIDRRVERRRRLRPGRSECARSAWRYGRARRAAALPAYTSETGRISAIFPEMRRLPNSTKTSFPTLGSLRRSLGIYQSTKISVGSRISAIGVPATSDWPTCARLVEMIPATGAKTRPPAKLRSTSSRRSRTVLSNSSKEASWVVASAASASCETTALRASGALAEASRAGRSGCRADDALDAVHGFLGQAADMSAPLRAIPAPPEP